MTFHCYSRPLQRAMADFGADHSFAEAKNKMFEHYGIHVPESSVRNITLFHAQQMHTQQENSIEPLKTKGCDTIVAETDGSMLPIVTLGTDEGDKRKQRTVHWKEARLNLAYPLGSTSPQFSATFGVSVDEAGRDLFNCAVSAGFGKQTYVHSVGDGATWIANQLEKQFGTQGHYLVDFYHVCEYLSAASNACSGFISADAWLEHHKKLLKNNQLDEVLANLKPYVESEQTPDSNAPVRACYRYLSNRSTQLDYKGAIEKGLPIGSGEIESAHRYIIQRRLKLPGAWWKAANAETMLTLRTVRANGKWEDYWKTLAVAA